MTNPSTSFVNAYKSATNNELIKMVEYAFESQLDAIREKAKDQEIPSCFVSYSSGENDVKIWLDNQFLPHLARAGIKVYCARNKLSIGENLIDFQKLILKTNKVVILCTPAAIKRVEKREKNPSQMCGYADEVNMAEGRYFNGVDKGTIIPIVLKGDKPTVPSYFRDRVIWLKFSIDDTLGHYYRESLEIIASIRGLANTTFQKAFEEKALNILNRRCRISDISSCRKDSVRHQQHALRTIDVRAAVVTKGINLPLSKLHFIGRQAELNQLKALRQQNKRVAICGLGGVGKSTLVLEYIKGEIVKESVQFVCYVNGATPLTIDQDLLKLADYIGLKKEEPQKRLQQLKDRLTKCSNYILVIDGVDTSNCFGHLDQRLPASVPCLIITTRMAHESQWQAQCALLELKVFSDESATEFVYEMTKKSDSAAELAKSLGNLPLALAHACTYIVESKITAKTFLQKFTKQQTVIFDKQITRPTGEQTILTTWNMSLCFMSAQTLELFSFCAFLAPTNIERSLLDQWSKKHCPEKDIDDLIQELSRHSMLTSTQPEIYNIHRLVQQVIRDKLSPEEQKRYLTEAVEIFQLIARTYDYNDLSTWSVFEPKVAHLHSLLCYINKFYPSINKPDFGKAVGDLEHSLGSYLLYTACHYSAAFEHCNRALGLREQFLNRHDLDIAASYSNMGNVFRKLKSHKEALHYLQQALGIRQRLGRHPVVATNLDDIGSIWEELDNAGEALRCFMQAAEIRQAVFSKTDATAAISYDRVGAFLNKLDRHEEALKFHMRALMMRENVLAQDNPSLATSYYNVGNTLRELNRDDEALERLMRSLKMREKWLGDKHLDVALSCNSIGKTLEKLNRYEEALTHLLRALEIYKELFDEMHPYITTSHINVGNVLKVLGHHEKALEHLKLALGMKDDFLEEQYFDIATIFRDLGLSLDASDQKSKTLKWELQSLMLKKKHYGEQHVDVADSYQNVSDVFNELSKHKKALEYAMQALEIRRKLLGDEHADIAKSYIAIGNTFQALGQHDKALTHLMGALSMRQKLFSEVHPAVAASYISIGKALRAQDNKEEALRCQMNALGIRQKLHRGNHFEIATSYNEIGNILRELGRYEDALTYLMKALGMRQELFGEKHLEVAVSYSSVGDVLKAQNDKREALRCQKRALELRETLLDADHPLVVASHNDVGDIFWELNDYQEALNHFEMALQILAKIYTEAHPQVVALYEKIATCLKMLGRTEENQIYQEMVDWGKLIQSLPDLELT